MFSERLFPWFIFSGKISGNIPQHCSATPAHQHISIVLLHFNSQRKMIRQFGRSQQTRFHINIIECLYSLWQINFKGFCGTSQNLREFWCLSFSGINFFLISLGRLRRCSRIFLAIMPEPDILTSFPVYMLHHWQELSGLFHHFHYLVQNGTWARIFYHQ